MTPERSCRSFEFEVFEIRIIQAKLAFKRPIRHAPLALKERQGLIQDFLKGHGRSSTSLRPASEQTARRSTDGGPIVAEAWRKASMSRIM